MNSCDNNPLYLILSEKQIVNLWTGMNSYFGDYDSSEGLIIAIKAGDVHCNGAQIVLSNGLPVRV